MIVGTFLKTALPSRVLGRPLPGYSYCVQRNCAGRLLFTAGSGESLFRQDIPRLEPPGDQGEQPIDDRHEDDDPDPGSQGVGENELRVLEPSAGIDQADRHDQWQRVQNVVADGKQGEAN